MLFNFFIPVWLVLDMVWLFSQTVSGNPGHTACYDGSPTTSVRKANFVAKVVVLECCVKRVCVPRTWDYGYRKFRPNAGGNTKVERL